MKRCPECDSSFPDTDKFCELDGTPLVASSDSDPDSLVTLADSDPDPDNQPELAGAPSVYQDPRDESSLQNWKTLAIVAVAGAAIGVVLFVVYHRLTRDTPVQDSSQSSNQPLAEQQIPLLPLPSPEASASPSVEPSPSPSARPTPTPPAESSRVVLSSSPVSTSGAETVRRGPVTIRLTDGTSIEAEEVWETKEGIWYRRRGLVTLLNRSQVNRIDQPPTPSPTATPSASP